MGNNVIVTHFDHLMASLKRQQQSLFSEIWNPVLCLPPTSAHWPAVALLTPGDPYLSGRAPSGAAAVVGPAPLSTPSMPSCVPEDIIFYPAEMRPFKREGDGRRC